MPQFLLKREAVTKAGTEGSLKGAQFKLTGPDAFHIAKVLRYRTGEAVELFDGHGGHFSGTLSQVSADAVEGVITDARPAPPSARVRLHLYPGLLKGGAWEWVLEKGTELGAATFTPVVTPRTVVLLERERIEAKRDRWTKLVLAASKQCGRGELPEIRPPLRFPEAIREATERGSTLLASERMAGASAKESIHEVLAKAAGAGGPVGRPADNPVEGRHSGACAPLELSLFIGPEGGFSDEEIELAEALDAVPFGLGSNTLRAETAALTATALVLYELGAL